MHKSAINRPILSLLLAMILGYGGNTAAWAQAYTAQISFLEKYASRLYDRGDYPGAWKEFQRIVRLDPNNPAAARYLKLITERTGQRSAGAQTLVDLIDPAINDIATLKADIARYETGSLDLEYLIRNLITENDALYSMLYLRSRELGELRAKFSGTPYAGPFDSLMKSLPPDRVPQRLHQSNELLKLTGEAGEQSGISVNTSASADEVQARLQNTASGQRPPRLAAAIDDKREMLVDKTLAVMDRQDNLARIKNNLARMNTTLKDIDTYYQSIKSDLGTRNFTDQKQFSDLMNDYAAKLKEIDVLKTRVENDDKRLNTSKDSLFRQNSSVTNIDTSLAAKDRQIAEFRSLLAEKNAIIAQQDVTLTFTDNALGKTGASLTSIESLLKQNDADMADLRAGVSKMRALVQPGNTALPAPAIPAENRNTALMMQSEIIASFTTQMEKLENQLLEARTGLSDKDLELQKTRAKVRSLEAGLTKNESLAWRDKNELLELKESDAAKTKEIAQLKTEVEALLPAAEKHNSQASVTPPGQPVNAASARLPSPANAEEVRILHETLAEKDNTIVLLKQQLLKSLSSVNDQTTAQTAETRSAVCNYSLDLQEKSAQLAALQNRIDQQARVIEQTDKESQLLQEKLAVMQAKQDAIKGVVQKRDMEFLRASAEADAKAKDLIQMTADRDALKTRMADRESAATLAESRLLQREEEIVRLNKEIAALQTTTTNAHAEIARLNNELQKLRK